MKLITYRKNDADYCGRIEGDCVVPAAKAENMLSLIDEYAAFSEMKFSETGYEKLADVKTLAPIPFPRRNIFCLGKNYSDHAREVAGNVGTGDGGIPENPIYFSKVAYPAVAHRDEIPWIPEVTMKLDYEVELGVIIGRGGKNISRENACSHIFGYTIINDVSSRDLQGRHGQWFKGKSLDSFCPMGPWIVTADEFPAEPVLQIKCSVNGELRQNASTADMIFGVGEIVSDLSRGMTLYPGDIIATGTPAGVGLGFKPFRFLQPGDEVVCEIEGIGELINHVAEE